MRTWLVSFSTLTALTAVAGAALSGCSSDNTTPGGDSGMDVTTTTDTGSADHAADAPADAAKEAAAACVDAAVNVATFNAGAAWACVQTLCDSDGGLNQCGADCVCNDAVLVALACVADAGPASATTCFTNALTPFAADPAVAGFVTCLTASSTPCNPAGGDGGAEAGSDGGTEAGHDGGTEAGTDGGGTDGGTDGGSDGGATDAPASG